MTHLMDRCMKLLDLSNLPISQIMICDPATANANDVVATAKLKMMRKGIGGLPVVDGKKLVGVITHRDIVLAGDGVLGLTVDQVMTKDVRTVCANAGLKDVVELMAETGFQRIPVILAEELVGMVTQSSVVHALAERL